MWVPVNSPLPSPVPQLCRRAAPQFAKHTAVTDPEEIRQLCVGIDEATEFLLLQVLCIADAGQHGDSGSRPDLRVVLTRGGASGAERKGELRNENREAAHHQG